MCGIFLCLFSSKCDFKVDQFVDVENLIKNRGPDAFNKYILKLTQDWNALILCSTLWTQGKEPVGQPILLENGNFFLWNGDVFEAPDFNGDVSDTEYLLEQFEKKGIEHILKICGPYSFFYYESSKNELWFGRDVIGRHSLLWHLESDLFISTSVSTKSIKLEEVPSVGIFKIDLKNQVLKMDLHPWSHVPSELYEISEVNIKNSFCHEILNNNNPEYIHDEATYNKCLSIFSDSSAESVYPALLRDDSIAKMVKDIKSLLYKSVQKRVMTQPKNCLGCKSSNCPHCRTSICFSGGLDSTVISLIADKFVPEDEPIDLFNVAFEKSSNYDVPDRISGRKSYEELKTIAPNRKWRFVEINVTQNELQDLRQKHIKDLIYPLDSILDDSLGCALWFAVRGVGKVNNEDYISNARIVLLGMGADELFGGYSRHKKKFSNSSWAGLGQQLFFGVRDIGKRNLGRDNRVAADHGRQPRIPFLDERVYSYVDQLPPWFKTYLAPEIRPGLGDKFLLRLIAWDLGLRYASILPKKAFQFGSRIANSKEKGHMVSNRL